MKTKVAAISLLLIASVVSAQVTAGREDFLLRIDGPLVIPKGEHVHSAVVISDNARIDGSVGELVVIGGNAVVSGAVEESVIMVGGKLEVLDGGRAAAVTLYDGEFATAPEAKIIGPVEKLGKISLQPVAWFFWFSLTLALLVFGLLFAEIAGRHLSRSAKQMGSDFSEVFIGTLFTWVALPALAILAISTGIGAPLGIVIFAFALPILGLFGYIISATAVGTLMTKRTMKRAEVQEYPYASVLVGIAVLQILLLIPVVGFVVFALAGTFGAGSLAVTIWRRTQQNAPPRRAVLASAT